MPKYMPYIYANLYPVLWRAVSNALKLCIEYKRNGEEDLLTETNPELIKCFSGLLSTKPKPDSHITEGLYSAHQKRKSQYPRVLKLTLKAFEDAQKIKANEAYLIPSPLYIIYHLGSRQLKEI